MLESRKLEIREQLLNRISGFDVYIPNPDISPETRINVYDRDEFNYIINLFDELDGTDTYFTSTTVTEILGDDLDHKSRWISDDALTVFRDKDKHGNYETFRFTVHGEESMTFPKDKKQKHFAAKAFNISTLRDDIRAGVPLTDSMSVFVAPWVRWLNPGNTRLNVYPICNSIFDFMITIPHGVENPYPHLKLVKCEEYVLAKYDVSFFSTTFGHRVYGCLGTGIADDAQFFKQLKSQQIFTSWDSYERKVMAARVGETFTFSRDDTAIYMNDEMLFKLEQDSGIWKITP